MSEPKPRGSSAAPKVIDLYRLLYEAERPLTMEEIAASSLLAVYKTPAYVAYREHLARDEATLAKGYEVPEGTWPESLRRTAWLWWVGNLVKTSRETKRIIVTTPEGGSAHGKKRDQLVYTANRDKPPMVDQPVMVERIAPWTPGYGALGARHAAGMEFLRLADGILQKKLPADVKDALTLAVKAIRNRG